MGRGKRLNKVPETCLSNIFINISGRSWKYYFLPTREGAFGAKIHCTLLTNKGKFVYFQKMITSVPLPLYMFSFHRASGLRLKLITTHIRGISFLQLYTGIAFALSRVLMPDAFPITLISGAF